MTTVIELELLRRACLAPMVDEAPRGATMAAPPGGEAALEVPSPGSKPLAGFQSGHPSRHTSDSSLTRPSTIQRRMISAEAGPN